MVSPLELISDFGTSVNNTETIWAVISVAIGYLIILFITKSTVKSKPTIFWLIFSGVFIVVWFFIVWLYANIDDITSIIYGSSVLVASFLTIFVVLIRFFNNDESDIDIDSRYKLIFSITLAVLIFSALASFISGVAYIGKAIIAGGILGLLIAIFWHNVKYRMNSDFNSPSRAKKKKKYGKIKFN